MGMSRDAIEAANQARKDKSDLNAAEIAKQKALGSLAASGARATKPTGTGNKGPKGFDAVNAAILAAKMDPNNKDKQIAAQAAKEAAGIWKTSEAGPGKLGVSTEGNEIKRLKMYEEAVADLEISKEYNRASPERKRELKAETKARIMSKPLPQDEVVNLDRNAKGGIISPIKLD
jgi:hypothetical protein